MTDTALSRDSGAARGRRFCLVLGLGIALFLLQHDRIAGCPVELQPRTGTLLGLHPLDERQGLA